MTGCGICVICSTVGKRPWSRSISCSSAGCPLLRLPSDLEAVVAFEPGLIREGGGSSRTAVPSSGKGRLAELMAPNGDLPSASAAVLAFCLPGDGCGASSRPRPRGSVILQVGSNSAWGDMTGKRGTLLREVAAQ